MGSSPSYGCMGLAQTVGRADIICFFLAEFWVDVLFRSRFVIEPMIFYSLYRVGDVFYGLCNNFVGIVRYFAGTSYKERVKEIVRKKVVSSKW